MKTVYIEARIDETTNKMGTVMRHRGFGTNETIDQILITIAILDNIKQGMLDKLNNKMARVK